MIARSRVPEGRTALGVRAHSGWAAYVVLGGESRSPEILSRGIMHLCDPKTEGSKQPFHHAEPMAFAAAEKFIGRCKASSQALADQALDVIVELYGPLRGCCVLTASGRSLPSLREILASHALIHAAEGEFYRDVVSLACDRKKIPTERVREKALAELSERLPLDERARRETLERFGKQVGTPWRQDEKLSAMAAWFALSMRQSRSGTRTP